MRLWHETHYISNNDAILCGNSHLRCEIEVETFAILAVELSSGHRVDKIAGFDDVAR